MNKVLGLLGISKKAGLLVIGDESVLKAAKSGKARLILSASDASGASSRRAEGYAQSFGGVWAQLALTKAELAAVLGRGAPGMLAVTDAGLAFNIASRLSEEDPEKYMTVAARLQRGAELALERRRELAAHRRNIRTGKRRTGK